MKSLITLFLIPVALFAKPDYRLIVDRDYSPFMGAEDFLFAEKFLESTYDYLLPVPAQPKRGVIPSVGRGFELFAFWLPLGYGMSVIQHEVFGHGYRLRNIGRSRAKVEEYSFDWPPPYGAGGGATSFLISDKFSVSNNVLTTIAGLEAQDIMASYIKMHAMAKGEFNPRLSMAYQISKLSLLLYASAEDLGKLETDDLDGHDVKDYIKLMNLIYPNDKMTQKEIRRKALVLLLDPTLYYSYAAIWQYIGKGTQTNMRLMRFGLLGFLPNLKVSLAPYGLEYYAEAFFAYRGSPVYAYAKGGRHADNTYGGLGLWWDRIWSYAFWKVGLRLDAWTQPKFMVNTPFIDVALGFRDVNRKGLHSRTYGAAGSLVLTYGDDASTISLFTDLGYKTKGYLPGQTTQVGMIARAGLNSRF